METPSGKRKTWGDLFVETGGRQVPNDSCEGEKTKHGSKVIFNTKGGPGVDDNWDIPDELGRSN